MLRLKLLGGFEARLDDGPPLLTSARKSQALLAYLAMSRGRPRARSHLATLLWGSHGNEQARNSLRQTLFVLRRALPGFSGLIASAGQVALQPGTHRTDACDLARLADDGPQPDMAIEIYMGEFLEDFAIGEPEFQEWLEVERRSCRDRVQTVLRKRLTRFEERGPVTGAIEAAQQLLAQDPLQEDVHRTLIRLFAAQGRHGEAARQRELCRETLRSELGLALCAETEQALGATASASRRLDFDNPRAPGTRLGHPPVVAVLPFTTDAGDNRLDNLAASLSEDIAANLATFRLFHVVSDVAAGTKGGSESLARALHTVTGSIRRVADSLHVCVRLLDAAEGHIIWSKRFTHRLSDALEQGEDLAMAICGTVAPILEILDMHLPSAGQNPVDAWGHYRRGMRLLSSVASVDNNAARAAFERAIDLDPTHVRAFAGLAQAHALDHVCALVPDRALARERCKQAARRAIELDPLESIARSTLAHPLRHERDFDLAIMELERARELSPSNGEILIYLGHTLDIVGRPNEGLELMAKGEGLARQDLGCRGKLARAALNKRDYDAAVEFATQAVHQAPTFPQPHLHLASAMGHLGRRREARAALQACEEARPGFAKVYNPSYAKQSDEEHYFEGLTAAGWG